MNKTLILALAASASFATLAGGTAATGAAASPSGMAASPVER